MYMRKYQMYESTGSLIRMKRFSSNERSKKRRKIIQISVNDNLRVSLLTLV